MLEDQLHAAFLMLALFSGVPLLLGSIAGLLVGVLQAATQIQEQSVSYLIKIVVLVICTAAAGSFALGTLAEFFEQQFSNIAQLGKMP